MRSEKYYKKSELVNSSGRTVTCCVAIQGRRYRLRGSHADVMGWLRAHVFTPRKEHA